MTFSDGQEKHFDFRHEKRDYFDEITHKLKSMAVKVGMRGRGQVKFRELQAGGLD